MSIKKPYIQIVKSGMYCYWELVAGNGVTIAIARPTWTKIKLCRQSAHRAGVTLGLEVRNEK